MYLNASKFVSKLPLDHEPITNLHYFWICDNFHEIFDENRIQ